MLRTKSGLPRHCSWNIDRHGKRRCRFRRNGFTTYLTGTPWSEDFMRQYAAALDGVTQPGNIGAARTKPGSFDALCVSYFRSPEFLGLAESTQRQRRNTLENFRAEHGGKPLRGLSRAHISAIIGAKANAPEGANFLLKVLRAVLNFAVDQGLIENNPATNVKKYKSKVTDTTPGVKRRSRRLKRRTRLDHAPGWRSRLASTPGKEKATCCAWAGSILKATALTCGSRRPERRC